MALVAAVVQDREEQKNAVSLQEISNLYFEYIERSLEFFIKEARENNVDAETFGRVISRHPEAVEDIAPQIPAFMDGLKHFWEGVTDASHFHIQDLEGNKGVFGGDLFPSYQQNIASTAGLYVDTIVLSDPFWHSRVVQPLKSVPLFSHFYRFLVWADVIVLFEPLVDDDLGLLCR